MEFPAWLSKVGGGEERTTAQDGVDGKLHPGIIATMHC